MHCLMRNVLFLVFVLIGNLMFFLGVHKRLVEKKCTYPIKIFVFKIFGYSKGGILRGSFCVQNGWLICLLIGENL